MKHGWNSLQHYLDIHEKVLRSFWPYMTSHSMYGPLRWPTPQWLQLSCRTIQLHTLSKQIIHVKIEKDAEVDHSQLKRPIARTWGYSYQANQPDGTQLIRYCSPDLNTATVGSHQGYAHHGYHHLHDFTSGVEKIKKVADDDWPHVGEFLTEVRSRF